MNNNSVGSIAEILKKKTKLWIITELYYPDQTSTAYILSDIAEFIVKERQVEIICGPANYDAISQSEILHEFNDVKITRIKSLNFNKNNLYLRALRLVIISVQLALKYLLKSNKNESVLIVTNPAPILLLFAVIARFTKREINVLVHDVFPENTLPAKIIKNKKSILYRLLKKIFNHAYSQFDTLIVLGRDMKSVIDKKIIANSKKITKVKIIENWADIDDVYPLENNNLKLDTWGISEKFVFLFAGNMGRNQALEDVFNIIKETTNTLIHFVFLGDGAIKKKMIQFKTSNNLDNITIGDPFLRSEQSIILNACNVGLVTLACGMEGLGVPSKSYNILAAGKPILYYGDTKSEISLLVKDNEIGWSFDNSTSLLEFFNNIDEKFFELSKVMGLKARHIAESQYSKSIILNKFKEIL